MSELEKIEALRAERQAESARLSDMSASGEREEANEQARLLAFLADFAQQVAPKVPMQVDQRPDGIRVRFGSSLWMRAPFRQFVFRVENGSIDAIGEEAPESNAIESALYDWEAMERRPYLDHPRLVTLLRGVAADYIDAKERGTLPRKPPKWYQAVQWCIGSIAFCAAWFAFAREFGGLGFLLGWIPAAFIGMIAGAGWPLWTVLLPALVLSR
jgi:hypothetical protein